MHNQPSPRWRRYILITLVVCVAGIHFHAGGLAWLGIATARAFLLVP